MDELDFLTISMLSYFGSIAFYELKLRIEAKKTEASIEGMTFITKGWLMKPFINVVLFKPLKISVKLKMPILIIYFTFVLTGIAVVLFQLSVLAQNAGN